MNTQRNVGFDRKNRKRLQFCSKSRIKTNIPVSPRLNGQINEKNIILNFLYQSKLTMHLS